MTTTPTKKSCPRIRLVREDRGKNVLITAYAAGKKQVGRVTLRNRLRIGYIEVDASLKRCGLGTRLYEEVAKIACDESQKEAQRYNEPWDGYGLRSDTERTAFSQGFWEKQVKKGRAVCVEYTGTNVSTVDTDAIEGRAGCSFYSLKCPVTSLAGARSQAGKRISRRRKR